MFEQLADGLRVVRRLRAPREEVFDAWINPERLRAWWGPPGFTVDDIDADLRVDGRYRIVMRPPDGGIRELVWTFREISPPERLAYTWQWVIDGIAHAETHVTVSFREAGDHTEIELTHVDFVDDADREHHTEGWAGCFSRLDATLNHMV